MTSFVDLHIHSLLSDGQWSLHQIFKQAKRKQLHTISITDHDTIIDQRILNDLSSEFQINYISGTEVSCYYEDQEIHILVYGKIKENSKLSQIISKIKSSRFDRANQIIANLNQKYKFNLNIDEIKSSNGYYGRPQIAKLMVRHKIVKSVKQAFIEYLDDQNSVMVDKLKIPVNEILNLSQRDNLISSIAHFSKYADWDMLDNLVSMGLNAVEIYHPAHSNTLKRNLFTFCEKESLMVTGGSDFHGLKLSKNKIGSQRVPLNEIKFLS